MPDHATLYCRGADRLDPADVERAAAPPGPLAALLGRRARAEVLERGAGGAPASVRVRVSGVAVTVNEMPAAARPAHLDGFRRFLAGACTLHDASAPERVASARCVLGVVLEPGDPDGACVPFLRALARRLDGLVFRPDGTLSDADGVVLAGPAPADGGGEDELDEDAPPDPPAAARVGRRALVLLWLAWRSQVEREPAAVPAETLAERLRWVEDRGLFEEMEPEEARLSRAPAGSWTEREKIDRGWACEAVAVLAWALGRLELPPHDVQVDPAALASALGLFGDSPAALAGVELRPPAELGRMELRLLAIHWRLRQFSLSPERTPFEAYAREGNWWMGPFDASGIAFADGDLAIGGAPIASADPRAVRSAHSIAMERHRAINWLLGGHPDWSEVDTST